MFGQGLYFHQIRHPLIVQSTLNHRESGKTATSRFMQRISQIPFQNTMSPFDRNLMSTVPYLPTVISQGLYGGYTIRVRLLNDSMPSSGLWGWLQPQRKHYPSTYVCFHMSVFKHLQRMCVFGTFGRNGYLISFLVFVQKITKGLMTLPLNNIP